MVALPAQANGEMRRPKASDQPSPLRAAQAISNLSGPSLPTSVANAVFQDIEARWSLDPTEMRVIQTKPKLWSDGCLGLAPPGEFCQEVLVMGWQVTVARRRQQWVYRSNNSGELVSWDQAGSRLDSLFTLQSQPIDTVQKPERFPKKVVFSAITHDGSLETQRETLLLKDGSILQRKDSQIPLTENQRIGEISPEAVKMFAALLKQQQFHQFDGLCYLGTDQPADASKTFFRSRKTTVCYTKPSSAQLPSALQTVIQAWTQLMP
ncbi:hypothetical protein C1752_03711 [Acaryochloris thomasi RCC1774]|uniref:Uncharacterized protein n=2 Tax=Acaryochloris TaxID=155977 RepID=A0A2W1JLW4_9CYAN|nr:hypothetical protein C1752_03711 [Acaryochloris thomasi RCC1774]